jgi:hypothetical protein
VASSIDKLIDVLCQGLTTLADDTERLRSLTDFPHLKITLKNADWYEKYFQA